MNPRPTFNPTTSGSGLFGGAIGDGQHGTTVPDKSGNISGSLKPIPPGLPAINGIIRRNVHSGRISDLEVIEIDLERSRYTAFKTRFQAGGFTQQERQQLLQERRALFQVVQSAIAPQ